MGIHMLPPLYEIVITPPGIQYGPPQTAYFYPDSLTGKTTVDGYIYRYGYTLTWSDCHDGPGSYHADTTGGLVADFIAFTISPRWKQIDRIIMTFDTSAIPAGSKIVEAKVRVRVTNKQDTGGWAPTWCVVESWPIADDDLVIADYQNIGAVALSEVKAYADIVVGNYNEFTFNDAGLAKINAGSITRLGFREHKYDCLNHAPTWVSDKMAYISLDSREQGLDKSPRLEVTWEPPL